MPELTHTDPPCEACRIESQEAIIKANERFRLLMELAKEQMKIVDDALRKHQAYLASKEKNA